MTVPATERFDQWCIVELFGHQRIAGRVQEVTIAGGALLRVDVPASDDNESFTRFYGPGAIYSMTPVAEAVARLAARRLRVEPCTVWVPELRGERALPAGVDVERPDVDRMAEDGEFEDDEGYGR